MNSRKFKCNLCGNELYRIRKDLTERLGSDIHKFDVVGCRNCGFHSLNPIPNDEELKFIYSNYASDGNRIEVENYRIKNVYLNKIKLIEKYTQGTKILDIGAGIGGFVRVSQDAGYTTTGLEMEDEQVKLAKKVFNVNLINDKLESFFIKNNVKYDVVFLHHVLEHFQYPKESLVLIKNMLKKDGILLIEVPNDFFIVSEVLEIRLGILTPKKHRNPYHHISFFSPITLKKLVEVAGYNILEINDKNKNINLLQKGKYLLKKFLANIFKMGITGRIELVAKLK